MAVFNNGLYPGLKERDESRVMPRCLGCIAKQMIVGK